MKASCSRVTEETFEKNYVFPFSPSLFPLLRYPPFPPPVAEGYATDKPRPLAPCITIYDINTFPINLSGSPHFNVRNGDMGLAATLSHELGFRTLSLSSIFPSDVRSISMFVWWAGRGHKDGDRWTCRGRWGGLGQVCSLSLYRDISSALWRNWCQNTLVKYD